MVAVLGERNKFAAAHAIGGVASREEDVEEALPCTHGPTEDHMNETDEYIRSETGATPCNRYS
jgi:hypothetical protein